MLLLLVLAACGGASEPTPAPASTPVPAPTPTMELTNEQNLPIQESAEAQPELSPLATPEEESAANADVQYVVAKLGANGTWTFSVTVAHPDTGWEDYADGWDVVLPDETVVKPDPSSPFTRLLVHPHVGEQPFTRSQGGIEIPEGIDHVIVRAHELVDGWGGKVVVVDLTKAQGPDFEVQR